MRVYLISRVPIFIGIIFVIVTEGSGEGGVEDVQQELTVIVGRLLGNHRTHRIA